MGDFTTGKSITCHIITVKNNTVVESDGIVFVNISNSSQVPYYNTSESGSYVVIHIINDDSELTPRNNYANLANQFYDCSCSLLSLCVWFAQLCSFRKNRGYVPG